MKTAFKALADPRRREIVQMSWTIELPASLIEQRFDDVTRSTISQHLSVLRSSGLIIERRDGAKWLYRANHGEMAKLRYFIDDFWSETHGRLRDLAEAAEETSRGARSPREWLQGSVRRPVSSDNQVANGTRPAALR